jgi:hypothetical protein
VREFNTYQWQPGKITTFVLPVVDIEMIIKKPTNMLPDLVGQDQSNIQKQINNWNKVFNPPNNYRNLSGSSYVDVKRNVAFTIPVASAVAVGVPQGASYATALVDAGGVTTVSGRLADNTAITGTGYLSPTGQIAHFQTLYLGKGSLLGKMTTATTTHIVSGTDTLSWLRKDDGATSRERSYKRGFSTTLTAAGGLYVAPTTGTIMAQPKANTANGISAQAAWGGNSRLAPRLTTALSSITTKP